MDKEKAYGTVIDNGSLDADVLESTVRDFYALAEQVDALTKEVERLKKKNKKLLRKYHAMKKTLESHEKHMKRHILDAPKRKDLQNRVEILEKEATEATHVIKRLKKDNEAARDLLQAVLVSKGFQPKAKSSLKRLCTQALCIGTTFYDARSSSIGRVDC